MLFGSLSTKLPSVSSLTESTASVSHQLSTCSSTRVTASGTFQGFHARRGTEWLHLVYCTSQIRPSDHVATIILTLLSSDAEAASRWLGFDHVFFIPSSLAWSSSLSDDADLVMRVS